jgi:hypothetical protein
MKWLLPATILLLHPAIIDIVHAENKDPPPTCAWGEPTDVGTGGLSRLRNGGAEF